MSLDTKETKRKATSTYVSNREKVIKTNNNVPQTIEKEENRQNKEKQKDNETYKVPVETKAVTVPLFSSSVSTSHTVWKWKEGIEAMKNAKRFAEDIDSQSTFRIQIGWNVSRTNYDEFVKNHGKTLGAKIMLRNGNVFIYEVPTQSHDRCAGRFAALLDAQVVAHCYGGQGTCIVNGYEKTPDGSWVPIASPKPAAVPCDTSGNPFPTVVLEVGDYESCSDLHNDAQEWLHASTTVRIVIIIKFFSVRTNGTIAMLAARYMRANPAVPQVVISFGTAPLKASTVNYYVGLGVPGADIIGVGRNLPLPPPPPAPAPAPAPVPAPACNGLGIPVYQIRVPSAPVYHGVPVAQVPAAQPANYTVDLFDIQQAIIKHL